MKEITLGKDRVALVDDANYDWLSHFTWHVQHGSSTDYAASQVGSSTNPNRKLFYMHRIILRAEKGVHVDHIDHNGLNNQRDNIRLCTPRQNMMNKHGHSKTSRFKGVLYQKRREAWIAQIYLNYRLTRLGTHDTEIDAALAYDKAARYHFGEFALLNFPDNPNPQPVPRIRRSPGRKGQARNKLTANDVADIRKRVANGERQRALSIAYDVGEAAISAIVHRKGWKHVLP